MQFDLEYYSARIYVIAHAYYNEGLWMDQSGCRKGAFDVLVLDFRLIWMHLSGTGTFILQLALQRVHVDYRRTIISMYNTEAAATLQVLP